MEVKFFNPYFYRTYNSNLIFTDEPRGENEWVLGLAEKKILVNSFGKMQEYQGWSDKIKSIAVSIGP